MNYGLPYKGSKNRLAERIVELLPPRKHFYDLFCGGCAVTHAAMMTRKWEDFTINDLNWQCPTLFIDALNGKYKDDTRWISREDFFRLKDSDPYVAFVWSFGNNLRDYIYSREIEPLKKAIHYALYFDDYSLASAMGHDLSFIADRKTREEKYMAIRHYFQSQDKYRIPSHEGGVGYEPPHYQRIGVVGYNVPTIAHTAKESQRIGREYENRTCGICPAQHFTRQQRMSSMERAGLDASLKKKKRTRTILPRTLHTRTTDVTDSNTKSASDACHNHVGGGKIRSFTDDYANIEIEPDSVIYCDIPYKDTNTYQKNGFDYERFYDWCFRQTEPVFISSYEMPSDFEEVAVFKHTQSLCATKTSTVYEKLFVPKTQKERLYYQQLSLF